MQNGFNYKGNKGCRMLNINERLNNGEVINKAMLAEEYGVTGKTVQRDINALRNYMAEVHADEGKKEIKFDRKRKGYCLVEGE